MPGQVRVAGFVCHEALNWLYPGSDESEYRRTRPIDPQARTVSGCAFHRRRWLGYF